MTSPLAPSQSELIRRAEALVPGLREHALETESLRRLPDANVAALRDSGILSVVQPASGGGLERDFESLVELTAIVARGCGSTGWCVGVMAVHNWLLGLFPEAAQREVFDANPRPAFAAVFAPMGTAAPAEGGVRLSGRWSFASGCDCGDWVGVAAPVSGDAPDLRMHLVPRGDFEISDNWFVSGLRGTGSKEIVVDDVFVPDHRALSLLRAVTGDCPGHAINDGPLFRAPFTSALIIALTGAGLGIAEGALEAFRERLQKRVMMFDGRVQKEQAAAQLRLAESAAEIDAARLLLWDIARRVDTCGREGRIASMDDRVRCRRNAAFAVRSLVGAVDRLFEASGGSALHETSPLQRAWRDIHAVAAHAALNWDTSAEIAGRHLLGLDLGPALV